MRRWPSTGVWSMPEGRTLRVLAAPAAYVLNDNATESLGFFTYQLLRALGRFNVEFTALCMRSEMTVSLPNVRAIPVLENAGFSQRDFLMFLLRYFMAGRKVLAGGGIDLVHHIFPFGYAVGFNPLLLAGSARGLPFVMGPALAPHRAGADMSDETTISKSYGAGKQEGRAGGKRGKKTGFLPGYALKAGAPAARCLFLKTLQRAGALVCADAYTESFYSSIVPEDKRRVLRIGIDLEAFSPAGGEPRREGKTEILAVAYLSRRKGIDDLVRAMKMVSVSHPGVYLRIVGDGPQRPELERSVAEMGLSGSVIFEGSVSHDKLVHYYRDCDIFCLPALSETWVVLQEAMACGKPVVTTDIGSHPEHVGAGSCGFLVKPRAPEELAGALGRLVGSVSLRREMGAAARRHMEDNYSWEAIAGRYRELYDSMLESR